MFCESVGYAPELFADFCGHVTHRRVNFGGGGIVCTDAGTKVARQVFNREMRLVQPWLECVHTLFYKLVDVVCAQLHRPGGLLSGLPVADRQGCELVVNFSLMLSLMMVVML